MSSKAERVQSPAMTELVDDDLVLQELVQAFGAAMVVYRG